MIYFSMEKQKTADELLDEARAYLARTDAKSGKKKGKKGFGAMTKKRTAIQENGWTARRKSA